MPTHLQTQFIFSQHPKQPHKKIKRACKPSHPTVQTFVQIRHDTATDGQKHEPITAGLRNWGFSG